MVGRVRIAASSNLIRYGADSIRSTVALSRSGQAELERALRIGSASKGIGV